LSRIFQASSLPRLPEGAQLVSFHKWFFCPISALCSKNNPQNIKHMLAVIFFACLDIEQKSSFLDGHQVGYNISYCPSINGPFCPARRSPRVSGCGVRSYASPQTLACPAIALFQATADAALIRTKIAHL